jgi:maltose O-acetyltransferase
VRTTTQQSQKPDLSEIATIVRSYARARIQLRGVRQGARVRCHGRLIVPRRNGIEVGSKAVFMDGSIPTELRCEDGAELSIGPGTLFNYGVSIAARRSVRIGARCMLASLVHVRDDDGFRVEPVVIGDDVWIAYGAVIEPGTIVGDGAVIATMAVVSGQVPSRSLVTGNPARFLPLEGAEAELGPPPEEALPAPEPALEPARPGGPSRDGVRRAILEWLDDTRLFGEAAKLVTSDTVSLRQGGMLDSLGVVELVMMLEKAFGVSIDRDRAARPDSQSINAFIDFVLGPPQ